MAILKNAFLAVILVSMSQAALAKPWDIWELTKQLGQITQLGEGLTCSSSVGNFEFTAYDGKNIEMKAFVPNGSMFGTDVSVENQLCETTLDEVLCYYGTGKWVGINLRGMYIRGNRVVIPGSVKTSVTSSDLTPIKCSMSLN